MTWNSKRVLVTGAGGFIGSHLTESLVQNGATVRALVHYNALGSWGWLDQSPLKNDLEVIAGDVTDRDSVSAAVRTIDVIFHLAALIAVPYSYLSPASFVHTNVEGTLNVFSVARDLGVERLVHTSTSEVYGPAVYVPIDEQHPLQAQSPYSATKIGADKIAEAFHRSFAVPTVTIRPFNTYGPRQSARAIIPNIVGQCLSSPVLRLGNLDPTRDMNFVSDTVRGFLLAGEAPEAIGRVINLGSGTEISIRDLAGMIVQKVGKAVSIETENARVRPEGSEVGRLVADNRLALSLLGWRPEVTLSEGLDVVIEWVRSHAEDYRLGGYAL
jgi:dTDP-glucose 4,6-dehydratase